MRLFIQGSLTLVLCFLSSFVFAHPQKGEFSPDNDYQYKYIYPCHQPSCESNIDSINAKINQKMQLCQSKGYACTDLSGQSSSKTQYWVMIEGFIREECAALSHEPNPITGAVGSTNEDDCSCASGWISGGGSPGENTYDCVIPSQQPEECYENGQIYDPGRGYCVLDCPSGQLNGVCLEDTADNSETCDKNSPDFQGSIGMGNKKQNICESERTCEGGSLGIYNGEQKCIPDEYGPPTCPSDGVLVMDEYGFVCEGMNDVPEEPQTPEEPNTDTDGDGEPDEYRPENDPNSTDKAVDGVSDRIDKTNEAIDQSNQRLNKINKSLDGIGKDLNTGLGAVNDNLKSIEDGMKPPPGGFNPDGFGGLVPTFTETATELSNELATIPAVTAVSGLTSLPQSTTCPIYTIPATPISGPIVMDIHCQVFGDYRGVISALFLFFWSGTALFLFLRA